MTKNEAHEKFLRWIEAHPSDEWRIDEFTELNCYSATAINSDGVIHTFNQDYEAE